MSQGSKIQISNALLNKLVHQTPKCCTQGRNLFVSFPAPLSKLFSCMAFHPCKTPDALSGPYLISSALWGSQLLYLLCWSAWKSRRHKGCLVPNTRSSSVTMTSKEHCFTHNEAHSISFLKASQYSIFLSSVYTGFQWLAKLEKKFATDSTIMIIDLLYKFKTQMRSDK